MFNDAQRDTKPDRIGVVIGDIEEWLDDNGYQVAEVTRTGELQFDHAGFAVGAQNDAVVIGYSEGPETEQPTIHTYDLDEIWTMDEDEFTLEIEQMEVGV